MIESDFESDMRDQQAWLDEQLVHYVVAEMAKRQVEGKISLSDSVKSAIEETIDRAVSQSGDKIRVLLSQTVSDLSQTASDVHLRVGEVLTALAQFEPQQRPGRSERKSLAQENEPPSPPRSKWVRFPRNLLSMLPLLVAVVLAWYAYSNYTTVGQLCQASSSLSELAAKPETSAPDPAFALDEAKAKAMIEGATKRMTENSAGEADKLILTLDDYRAESEERTRDMKATAKLLRAQCNARGH
jgi:hypothetical protein